MRIRIMTLNGILSLFPLVLISCLVDSSVALDDVPEFQYPCYVDICTFPSQYCNSRERRCSTCSRGLCLLPDSSVPLACRYTCLKNKQITTVRPATTSVTASPQRQTDSQYEDVLHSLQLMVLYCAIVTTVFAVVIVFFIAVYVYRKLEKSARDRNTPTKGTIPKSPSRDQHNYDSESQCPTLLPKKENNFSNTSENVNSYTSTTVSDSQHNTDSAIEMQPMTSNDQSLSGSSLPPSNSGEPTRAYISSPVNATVDLNTLQHHKPWPDGYASAVQASTENEAITDISQTPLLQPVQNR